MREANVSKRMPMGEPYSDAAKKWHDVSYRKERAAKNKHQSELVYGTRFDDGLPFRSPPAVNRTETNEGIQWEHGRSFISEIQIMLDSGQKQVRVLDLRGGSCMYSREIRERFESSPQYKGRVKVFTTGLRKLSARHELREASNNPKAQLHADDLKWRSVKELHDYEEFDLIIDTFGEFHYTETAKFVKKPSDEWHMGESRYETQLLPDSFDSYFYALIAKLKKGGRASIIGDWQLTDLKEKPRMQELLEKELEKIQQERNDFRFEVKDSVRGNLNIVIIKN